MTLSVFTGSSLAPRLVGRLGLRAVVALGLLLAATGLLLLTAIRPGGAYLSDVLPGGVLSGLGMGLALVSSTIAATQGVPASQGGLASGLLNMSRLFGGALGLAALSTIAAAHAHASSTAQGLTDGFGVAFRVGAALCLCAAGVAAVGLRPRVERELEPRRPDLEEPEQALAA
jgi:MFS family permease